MAVTKTTGVAIRSEVEVEEVKRKGKRFFFFNTEWWETVSTKTVGNDIHVKTDSEVRDVYVNGVKYINLSVCNDVGVWKKKIK